MKLLEKLYDKDFGSFNEQSNDVPNGCARAVLFDENNKIALMYMPKFIRNNSSDFYVLPGGGIENNETVEEALKREILEETGCNYHIVNEMGYFEINCAKDNIIGLSYYFLLKIEGEKKQPQMTNDEINWQTKLYWCDPEEAFDLVSRQNVYDNMWLVFLKYCDSVIISKAIEYMKK